MPPPSLALFRATVVFVSVTVVPDVSIPLPRAVAPEARFPATVKFLILCVPVFGSFKPPPKLSAPADARFRLIVDAVTRRLSETSSPPPPASDDELEASAVFRSTVVFRSLTGSSETTAAPPPDALATPTPPTAATLFEAIRDAPRDTTPSYTRIAPPAVATR